MRNQFAILYLALIVTLGVCAWAAMQSRKAMGRPVALMVGALLPPVVGNLIIIASGSQIVSAVGYYIYFLGMDLVMFAVLRFTFAYCDISWPGGALKVSVYAVLGLDAAQLLCNPLFHHAFDTEAISVDGFPYYRLLPHLGQGFHRLVDYGILAAVIVIFAVKVFRSPRVYSERYSVIFLTMILTTVWETYYIFSRTPVDTSMIGFGVFGMLVFYFALYYRPMRLLDRMLAGIASEMPEALFFFDANRRCIWANQPGIRFAGVEGEDFDRATARLKEIFGALVVPEGDWTARRVLGAGGSAKHYVLEKHTVAEADGRVVGSFLSIRDNTEEQRALQREKYVATHDILTGVYTREHLYRRVRETLQADPDTDYLVVFVDVKDFKLVNDIFGNDFGDRALKRIAEWISAEMADTCLYGRLAGDTFGVCMPVSKFEPERIKQQLSNFVISDSGVEHHILIHLGVYEVTEPEIDVSVMFDRAHMALTTIKDEYKTNIAWYDGEMRRRVLWSQYISSSLQDALAKRQVRPYLQPIVDDGGHVVGAEALVRWVHPANGFLSPAAFIPVFEKNGMIAEVDRYMWRSACETLRRWQRERPELFISVNISPTDFYFMDVAAELRGIVRECGVDPSRLRIEITETVMMTDIENRMRMLRELRGEGFVVEIDDFGSGYSSLSMLKDMPVDVLKIDMSFLTEADGDDRARTIVRNIIRLTEELGIASLTEGVETAAQYDMLSGMGCRLFQGFYFARPMPVEDFEAFCEGR